MTQRICFQLRVDPARIDEYKERHASVWPEMREALSASGWTNYSLFLSPEGVLIGYLECENFERSLESTNATDVNARWQASMSSYFVGLDGGPPDAGISPWEEVFHLD